MHQADESGKRNSAENLLALRGSTQMTTGALLLGSHAKFEVKPWGLKSLLTQVTAENFPNNILAVLLGKEEPTRAGVQGLCSE